MDGLETRSSALAWLLVWWFRAYGVCNSANLHAACDADAVVSQSVAHQSNQLAGVDELRHKQSGGSLGGLSILECAGEEIPVQDR